MATRVRASSDAMFELIDTLLAKGTISSTPLVRVSDNTYKGHIFLDWPIDEDYYGLGVCEWRIGTVDAVFTRDRELTQSALLIGSEVTHEADTLSYCRRNMRGDQDRFCSIPIDPARVIDLGKSSYQVEMSSRKY